MLKAEGLKAGVLYYDGQFNDARMALALALTAQQTAQPPSIMSRCSP